MLFLASAIKKEKLVSITSIVDGKIIGTKEYPTDYPVFSVNSEIAQTINADIDLDDPFQKSTTKVYKRPGKFYAIASNLFMPITNGPMMMS